MKHRRLNAAIWAGLLFSSPFAGAIELGRLDLGSSGALISSCGGMNASGSSYAVGDKGHWLAGRVLCDAAQTASPQGSVSASASYLEATPSVNTSALGSTVMGQTHLWSHFRANNSAGFAQAEATGGWTDMITLTPLNAADLGKSVTLSFGVAVSGTLQGIPSGNGYAQFGLTPYLNDMAVPGQQFSVQGQGQFGFPYDQSLNQTVSFNVNVILGTPFELSLFARANVGVAGAGPDWFSESTVDFGNTISWAGISGVSLAGSPVGYNLSSASGIDWQQAYAPVPEPAEWLLMGAGLALLAGRRRSQARR